VDDQAVSITSWPEEDVVTVIGPESLRLWWREDHAVADDRLDVDKRQAAEPLDRIMGLNRVRVKAVPLDAQDRTALDLHDDPNVMVRIQEDAPPRFASRLIRGDAPGTEAQGRKEEYP
jgi:hypothetical protein